MTELVIWIFLTGIAVGVAGLATFVVPFLYSVYKSLQRGNEKHGLD